MAETEPVCSPILDRFGKPARAASSTCPQCGAGKDKRVQSSGFGVAHPVCAKCGHEFFDEVWRG